jgi:hypothetical protein
MSSDAARRSAACGGGVRASIHMPVL